MPLTVITLRKTTPPLRGDLSKWMQEIATGVYIGNFNARVREKLWQRVIDSIGSGEATLSYASRNELGYSFETHNTNRQIIMSDGIPLVLLPSKEVGDEETQKLGFSKAAKFHKARKFSKKPAKVEVSKDYKSKFVVVDIETDGLDPISNNILELGAVKYLGGKTYKFSKLVKPHSKYTIPIAIENLTGITDDLLNSDGQSIQEAIEAFRKFIEGRIIVGYNVNFDIQFINNALKSLGLNRLSSRSVDILLLVKKENMYLENYKLKTVLDEYGIEGEIEHRALPDAELIYELTNKLNDFEGLIRQKG